METLRGIDTEQSECAQGDSQSENGGNSDALISDY